MAQALQLDPVVAPERAESGPVALAPPAPAAPPDPAPAAPAAPATPVAADVPARAPVRAESGKVSVPRLSSDTIESPDELAAYGEAPGPKAEQSRPEKLVAWPAPEAARSAEDQLEQRRARIVERIATVRDGSRMLADLGVSEDARKGVTQALQELQNAIGGGAVAAATATALKEPKLSLAAAPKETLDAIEPLLGTIEDKLLALDDQLDDATFESQASGAARNKRVLARYGRLLASRRMPVGARRNRFEWLAMQLLTRTNEVGQLLVAPPERALVALQQLIGDLPYKVRSQEVAQVTDYLFDAGKRLDALQDLDELFESGLYTDVHGYKVSMREHLLSPEVVYRTALFEARLHNHLERWIAERAREAQDGEPIEASALRMQLRASLRAERDDVDQSLGAKAKPRTSLSPLPAPMPGVALRQTQPGRKRAAAAAQATQTLVRRRRMRVALDRGLLIALSTLLVVSVAFVVVRQTGMASEASIRKLTREEMPALSPLLVLGDVRTLDDDQSLHGWISGTRWRALDPVQRRDAAEELAQKLLAAKIQSADLFDNATRVIVIRNGMLISAAGAAP